MSARRYMANIVVVGAMLLTGCVSRQQSLGTVKPPNLVPLSQLAGLTLQVGDQKGGTESLLRAAGGLDNLPYRIAFSTFTSGPPQIEAATAGKITFAITGDTPPIFGAAANAKVKVVSAYDGSGRGDQILVHANSAIRSVADLRGRTIAVTKGSSAHGNILDQLDNAGLKPADVRLVFLQPADGFSAFTSGQADAWAIWDPYTAQAERQLLVRSIAVAKHKYSFGIASDQALADPKRNTALADLLVRFERATFWARVHPQEWAEKYAAEVGLDVKVGAVSQGRSLLQPTALSDAVVSLQQRLTALLAAAGQLQSAPQFANWVDRRFSVALESNLNNASARAPS
jgi:sulfonate transport system substrate-binding protein